jgi:hypothetical protein
MATEHESSPQCDDGVVTDIAPDFMRDVIRPLGLVWSDACCDDYRRVFGRHDEYEHAADAQALRQILGEGRFAALVLDLLTREPSPLPLSA